MSERKDIYGRYSLGSGAILADPDKVWASLADPQVLDGYRKSMLRDLRKSGIRPESMADWNVMDVGTGRQALVFLELGAKRVEHFDISPENVARMSAYRSDAGLDGRLQTTCCDIVETDLGRDKYDFVYLNGIVQHFSDVGRGISNCASALKTGGMFWLYFYRSGTFDNFVLYALRTLMYDSNVVPPDHRFGIDYVGARLFYSDQAKDNYLTSIYMDGVFTRQARLYTVATYLRAMELLGFEVASSSGIDPIGRDVDHQFARAAAVVTLRKLRAPDAAAIEAARALLAPAKEVDQLDEALYDEPEIRESAALFKRLIATLNRLRATVDLRALAAMRVFAFLAQIARAPDFDPARRHPELQALLKTILAVVEAEIPSAS